MAAVSELTSAVLKLAAAVAPPPVRLRERISAPFTIATGDAGLAAYDAYVERLERVLDSLPVAEAAALRANEDGILTASLRDATSDTPTDRLLARWEASGRVASLAALTALVEAHAAGDSDAAFALYSSELDTYTPGSIHDTVDDTVDSLIAMLRRTRRASPPAWSTRILLAGLVTRLLRRAPRTGEVAGVQ